MSLNRKLRYGMIGGGPGSFVGSVHRHAAALDGKIELVAGSFSASLEKSKSLGAELCLAPDRIYASYQEMAEKEAAKPPDARLDFVSVLTPNHLHFDICETFIKAGFDIVCDKPLTNEIEEAEALCNLVAKHGVVFVLTHNYSGYPMVKQARELVQDGEIGALRKVVVEYSQGWLTEPIERTGQKQAGWRTDPRMGISACAADIGTHAEHLSRYVTGLEIESLCAEITSFVAGRQLEDDANCLLRYKGGAKGVLISSQIAAGEENNLNLRVYGSKGSLAWRQENPNYLHVRYIDGPEKIYKHGNPYLTSAANNNTRLPAGHPEAFLEAFANIYRNAAAALTAKITGQSPQDQPEFPTVQDGARGVHFIHKVIESGGKWVEVNYAPPGK